MYLLCVVLFCYLVFSFSFLLKICVRLWVESKHIKENYCDKTQQASVWGKPHLGYKITVKQQLSGEK